VPNGAAISEAHVLFSVDEVRPGQSDVDVTVSIYGQLSANAAKPSATGGDLSSRPATSPLSKKSSACPTGPQAIQWAFCLAT
jgi:hypothetical protein